MGRQRKLMLFWIIALCLCIVSIMAVLQSNNSGMKRISSHVIHGSKESGDETIQLPNLKAGQLVVIEAEQECKITSCLIRHSSIETFAIESQPFINNRLEYEIHEDADYSFHLNCENTEFCISISIWEATNPNSR